MFFFRSEFNNKLAGIGLDCEGDTKAKIETAQPTQATATLITKEAPKSQTSSIYNLIKKREETTVQTVEEKKVSYLLLRINLITEVIEQIHKKREEKNISNI